MAPRRRPHRPRRFAADAAALPGGLTPLRCHPPRVPVPIPAGHQRGGLVLCAASTRGPFAREPPRAACATRRRPTEPRPSRCHVYVSVLLNTRHAVSRCVPAPRALAPVPCWGRGAGWHRHGGVSVPQGVRLGDTPWGHGAVGSLRGWLCVCVCTRVCACRVRAHVCCVCVHSRALTATPTCTRALPRVPAPPWRSHPPTPPKSQQRCHSCPMHRSPRVAPAALAHPAVHPAASCVSVGRPRCAVPASTGAAERRKAARTTTPSVPCGAGQGRPGPRRRRACWGL